MNNDRARKYARTLKKYNSSAQRSDDSELSLSATQALSIIGGTFLVGLISGKLLCMCMRKY